MNLKDTRILQKKKLLSTPSLWKGKKKLGCLILVFSESYRNTDRWETSQIFVSRWREYVYTYISASIRYMRLLFIDLAGLKWMRTFFPSYSYIYISSRRMESEERSIACVVYVHMSVEWEKKLRWSYKLLVLFFSPLVRSSHIQDVHTGKLFTFSIPRCRENRKEECNMDRHALACSFEKRKIFFLFLL